MSDGLNRVILLGNLGADPEIRYTKDGTAVLTVRLATNETYLDKNKQRVEKTEWHNVVLFGARAESLVKMLSKGSGVLVEGGLRTTSYEKDGVVRYKTEVVARDLCFAGKRSTPPVHLDDTLLDAPPAPNGGKSTRNGSRSAPATEAMPLEDIPF